MSRIDEELTEQFYRWERLGRSWRVFDEPVVLEPPFRPFVGHFLPRQHGQDDGRRPTFLSRIFERLSGNSNEQQTIEHREIESEPEPKRRGSGDLDECQLALPLSRSLSSQQAIGFLRQACRSGHPLALEIIGTEREIIPQFVASPDAIGRVERALVNSYQGIVATRGGDPLRNAWQNTGSAFGVIELGLGKEFMLPLGSPNSCLLADVVAALDGLGRDECGIFQLLFEPVTHAWNESILAAVTDGDEGPFFVNRPEFVPAAERKTSSPLFAAVIRLAASATGFERAWETIADMAVAFSALADPSGNYLVPLDNAECEPRFHEADLLNRLSRRSGVILNSEELAYLVSLPVASLSPRLRRHTVKTKAAPHRSIQGNPLVLGVNQHGGIAHVVELGAEDRVRHMHILGASGTGKSTLLFNLIRQDIENGEGLAILDPHGDLIDRILGVIPPERIEDIILLDPSDEEYAVGFNILSAHSDLEKTLLASDLVSVFERLSTTWGDQMNAVLRNAILAFLESSGGGTLSDLRRFLVDPAYRKAFLKTVADADVVYYWEKAFPLLSGNRSVGPVLTRLDAFLSPKPIRRIVSQRGNRLDFARIMDSGKILLVKLAQGQIGRENAYLLGSLVMTKLQQAAMSRQGQMESNRRDFWMYLDEFHNFITPSMAEILSGARKYRVGLTLAHQELRQLGRDPEVAGAVLSNPYTRIVFRVGDADARTLESGFSFFEAKDLQNLGTGEAICRIERSDFDFNLAIPPATEPNDDATKTRQRVIDASRRKYAIPRAEADATAAEVHATWQEDAQDVIALAPRISDKTAHSEPPQTVLLTHAPSPAAPPVTKPGTEDRPEALDATLPASPPPDLGRGGAQHKAIQQRLKSVAESFGYRAIVELPVLDGQGSIDLVLEKEAWRMACEISVTTTIDHEIGNIRKCLKAEFQAIAVVCPKAARLEQIKSAAMGCLAPTDTSRVTFYSPEEFIAHIEALSPQAAETSASNPPPEVEHRRGYKIKRSYAELSPEELRGREDAALKAIAETMRRKRGGKPGPA